MKLGHQRNCSTRSAISSTWRGRRGSMRASCLTGSRLPSWSDGRSPICPYTPYGRHCWLSCSRPCSATVDAASRALHRRLLVAYRLGFPSCTPQLWINKKTCPAARGPFVYLRRHELPCPSDARKCGHRYPLVDGRVHSSACKICRASWYQQQIDLRKDACHFFSNLAAEAMCLHKIDFRQEARLTNDVWPRIRGLCP